MNIRLKFDADPTLHLAATVPPPTLGLQTGATVSREEIDPTVPAWAKKPDPPTPDEIGAVGDDEMIEISNQDILDMFKKQQGGN